MFGRVIYDNQNIYLNSNRVLGAISFDAEIGLPFESVPIIGTGCFTQSINSEITKTFNFSNYTSQKENLILDLVDKQITGLFKYKSSLNDKTGNWTSVNSIISSYTLNCAIGEIPTSDFSFEGFGQAGFFDNNTNINEISFSGFSVVRPGDLSFSGNNFFYTNRLQSITYSFEVPFKKQHFIGYNFESIPLVNGPITLTVDMNFELDDAESGVLTSALCESDFNGTFEFIRCGDNERRFLISGAKLISCSVEASLDNNATFNCTYQSYVNNFNDLKKLITGSMW